MIDLKVNSVCQAISRAPRTWMVTGVAGFIGSNLLETLLRLDQHVIGVDNFATGKLQNIEESLAELPLGQRSRFRFIEADIRDAEACRRITDNVHVILHQAALGSVPRSIADPLSTHASNLTGFLNLLWAAKENGIAKFVFASSSSVYGDHPALPKIEQSTGNCLSPYALTKKANELYAEVFGKCYGLEWIGLRYFNVFGPRQDPNGPYAAVIPKWIAAMIKGEPVQINGDGETSRDFCYVKNIVQANLLAATTQQPEAINQVYNVAVGGRTTLNQLYQMLRTRLIGQFPHLETARPQYQDFRAGDVRHSNACIDKARNLLHYEPSHTIEQGLDEALPWYISKHLENSVVH